ncbi:MAG: hypothetical protein E7773_02185 [Sphingomonas sp.]|uniref:hypothetical protein n=1 Tax=Sphingomonas sp. TaxID=28214 RepID=UPI00121AF0FB|nr:hypothetical protein [Sphingomonas sp.]THD37809.1 MAG: hypothetical protein E7773_02185 [Sphingomonas sp.]
MNKRYDLAGMTVNERLFETNQLSVYEEAIAAADAPAVRKVLESIDVDEPSIVLILQTRLKP